MEQNIAATILAGPLVRWRRLVLGIMLITVGGCQRMPSGVFEIDTSGREGLTQEIVIDNGWSVVDERDQVEAVLVSQAAGEGGDEQILVLRTFWRTRAARSPDAQAATNANVEYLVRQNGRTGWYRGAGYLQAKGLNDEGAVRLKLHSSQVRLYAADEGFAPPFTDANLRGSTETQGDPAEFTRALEQFRARTGTLGVRD